MRNFKRIYLTITFSLIVFLSIGQSPEAFKYQAVIRDATGQVIIDQNVSFQISILSGSADGTSVYTETHTTTTNQFGLVNLNIGNGVTTDDLTNVDWGSNLFFIQVEVDQTGGTDYQLMGTSQLLSVPYALHAKTAETVSGTISETDPTFTAWDKSTGISITESQISDLNHFSNTDETDPLFNESVASGITATDTANWNSGQGSFTETDPVYTVSQAANITATHITNLGNLSGTNTGDQDISSFATQTALEDTASAIRTDIPDVSGFISNETDPVYTAWNKDYNDLTNTPNIIDSISAVIDTTTQFVRTELDADPTNEIQTLSVNGNDLSISGTGGNTVSLNMGGNVLFATRPEIDAITPENGQLVYNTTENLLLMWNSTNWLNFNLNSECFPQPTIANADEDQTINTTVTSVTLAANIPVDGTGIWSVVSGEGGSFTDVNDPTTTFSGNSCTDYTLQWEIATACTQSTDNVNISFDAIATTANAGDDIYSPTELTVTLNGSNPTIGTGVWSVESGSGGSFSDPNKYNSDFTGNDNETYTLRWTITACNNSFDDVKVYIGNVIGQYKYGGVIFYVDGTGLHGLVCQISDAGNTEWGCDGTAISGADGVAIGTGAQNTIDIEAGCTTVGTAADICANLSLNDYDDWFLPSLYELEQIFVHETEINASAFINGGSDLTDDVHYWSSSEFLDDSAYCYDSHFNILDYLGKSETFVMFRAVRAF